MAILHRISGVARTFCTGMGVEQAMIRMQWHLNDAPGRESVPGVGGVVLLN